MRTTQYPKQVEDDFVVFLSDWISHLHSMDVKRISFRRFKPDNREIGKGGFLSIYQHAIFTGAGNTGRDIADLQWTFLGPMPTKIWLSQTLFWHHALVGKCTSLSFAIDRNASVYDIVYTSLRAEHTQRESLVSYEACGWLLDKL